MNKEDDRLMGTILVFLICVLTVLWGTRDGEVAEVRHAVESSYGEPAKPQGHGL